VTPGTKLGPYEILSPIGAGGMGEVYRARDTRLGRDVAIKFSKEQFSEHFEREARAVAALNHPNICHLYDVGPNYLVMELVEGEPVKGPLPLQKALEYAGQILDALDAAHRSGIVHRDLKPANILVAKQGVKVLDFGLAKQTRPLRETDVTQALTEQGQIVGTLQYMSPEQLQGKDVDSRADIFSFGCVLYEMLTGKRAFDGSNAASVIAAVMQGPAPAVTEVAPAALDRVVKKCLEKDPDDRWQAARDLKTNLAWSIESAVETPKAQGKVLFYKAGWAVASLATLAAAAVSFIHFREKPPEMPVARFSITPPEKVTFVRTPVGAISLPSLSPDGRRLLLSGRSPDGKIQIWVRPLDAVNAYPLAGTEGGLLPFWSPDNNFIGFFADGKLKTIDAAGGAAITLADAAEPRGGAWSSAGIIVFAPKSTGPLLKISASGGAATPATELDAGEETAHRLPFFLPDGQHFLFAGLVPFRNGTTIHIGSLASPKNRVIAKADSQAIYAQGHLLFLRGGTLMAQPFDTGSQTLRGEPVPIADHVQGGVTAAGAFSASANGMLVFENGAASAVQQLELYDRSGKRAGTIGEPGAFPSLQFSPDSNNIAVSVTDASSGNTDIWIYDAARGLRTRFTFDPAAENEAVWSPDGAQIVFNSSRKGHFDLYRKPSNGTGTEELLYADTRDKFPLSWSPDGKALIYYTQGDPQTGLDLWILPNPLGKPDMARPLFRTQFNEVNGQFSPDGKWIAYESDESGRYEIFVVPFPGPGGKRQISAGGGSYPRWRRDGREIFYVGPDNRLRAAEVSFKGGTLETGEARPLFVPVRTGIGYAYDVSADGQRFLTIGLPEQPNSQPLTLVQNWMAGLKK
jgi:serine/threonine protein kinase/Tol biopolymer transport system component